MQKLGHMILKQDEEPLTYAGIISSYTKKSSIPKNNTIKPVIGYILNRVLRMWNDKDPRILIHI